MDIHPKMNQLRLQSSLAEQAAEQSFELDYLLADYLPDIFKMIKCDILPAVTGVTTMDGRMTADLEIEIRILYLAEKTHELCVITQKQQLQKQVDLPGMTEEGTVSVSVRPDQCRCRAVNPRRVDLRGTLILKIEPECSETVQYLGEEQKDTNLQLRTAGCSCLVGKETVCEEITISEHSALPYGKPAIENILLYRVIPIIKEVRRSGDKVICKGSLRLHLLYQPKREEEENPLPESAEFMIPVDAVIGADFPADAQIQAAMEVLGTELSVDADGKDTMIEGQYRLKIMLVAPESKEIHYVCDLYSTACPVQMHTEEMTCLSMQAVADRVSVCKNLISVTGGGISQVVDLFGEIRGTSLRNGPDGTPILTVNLQLDLFAADENGMLFCAERLIPCELNPDLPAGEGEPYFDPKVSILSESYRIGESGELEVQTELQVRGIFCRKQHIHAVVGVTADEEHPYQKQDAALHLYYAKEGEPLWEIAKRFRIDYAAMLLENDLGDDCLDTDKMLLIPVI